VEASKSGYETIDFEYFVGGYPLTDSIEMGTSLLVKQGYESSSRLNITGRMYNAFTN